MDFDYAASVATDAVTMTRTTTIPITTTTMTTMLPLGIPFSSISQVDPNFFWKQREVLLLQEMIRILQISLGAEREMKAMIENALILTIIEQKNIERLSTQKASIRLSTRELCLKEGNRKRRRAMSNTETSQAKSSENVSNSLLNAPIEEQSITNAGQCIHRPKPCFPSRTTSLLSSPSSLPTSSSSSSISPSSSFSLCDKGFERSKRCKRNHSAISIHDINSNDDRWMEKYHQLKLFFEKHGHCNITFAKEYNHLKTMAYWVSNQKVAYKRKCLPQHRKMLLKRLNFDFGCALKMPLQEGKSFLTCDGEESENDSDVQRNEVNSNNNDNDSENDKENHPNIYNISIDENKEPPDN